MLANPVRKLDIQIALSQLEEVFLRVAVKVWVVSLKLTWLILSVFCSPAALCVPAGVAVHVIVLSQLPRSAVARGKVNRAFE